MPHHAATIAIPPRPLKKLKISISPRPEFCIPVSMAIVRLSITGRLKVLAVKYPIINAMLLCSNTKINIR